MERKLSEFNPIPIYLCSSNQLLINHLCLGFFAKEVEKSGLKPQPASLDIRAPDPPVMIDLEVRL